MANNLSHTFRRSRTSSSTRTDRFITTRLKVIVVAGAVVVCYILGFSTIRLGSLHLIDDSDDEFFLGPSLYEEEDLKSDSSDYSFLPLEPLSGKTTEMRVSYEVPTGHSNSKIPMDSIRPKSPSLTKPKTNYSSPGLHVCTCLKNSPDNHESYNFPPIPKSLRWLHFPKAGTSFISTLWSYSCSTQARYIDLGINSFHCNNEERTAFNMYDFALMKRYPWEIYCAPNLISLKTDAQEDMHLGLVGGTQHMPLNPSVKPQASKRLTKLLREGQIRKWGSEFENNVTVVGFFRQPEQRIISAFYDARHANGFSKNDSQKLFENTWTRDNQSAKCTFDDSIGNPLECFANFPGIAGCMARMLTGQKCADSVFHSNGMENVADAVDVILNHLVFVGLLEEWNESICQFHRLFSGRIDDKTGYRHWDHPLQGEFANIHPSRSKKILGVKDLNGFKDVADTVVYETAKLKFAKMVGDEKCYKFMTWEEIEAQIKDMNAETIAEQMPFIRIDNDGEICQPKTCSDLGKQCGEWPDGCGSEIVCGMCNQGRSGLPPTWRVKCVEGKCIDYCPPWDEEGYWFTSDMSQSATPHFLRKFASQIESREQQYLSPTEAVGLCVSLCDYISNRIIPPDGLSTLMQSRLCTCGERPTAFLKANFTLDDYSIAHDLMTHCRLTKTKSINLLAHETQPVCCSPFDRKIIAQAGWRPTFILAPNSLEGEYFAHIRVGCDGHLECERAARDHGAEMAVFDFQNSMCYLARNVFALSTGFPPTKDQGSRFILDLRKRPYL